MDEMIDQLEEHIAARIARLKDGIDRGRYLTAVWTLINKMWDKQTTYPTAEESTHE